MHTMKHPMNRRKYGKLSAQEQFIELLKLTIYGDSLGAPALAARKSLLRSVPANGGYVPLSDAISQRAPGGGFLDMPLRSRHRVYAAAWYAHTQARHRAP